MDRTRKYFLRLKAIYYTHCFASIVFFFPHFSVYLRYHSLAQHVKAFFFHILFYSRMVWKYSSLCNQFPVNGRLGCFQLCAIAIGTARKSLIHASVCVFIRFGQHYNGSTWLGQDPSMFIVRVVEKRYFHMKLDGQRRSSSILVFVPRRLGQVLWRLTHMVAYLLTYWSGMGQNSDLQLPHLPLHYHSVSIIPRTCGCLAQ